MKLKTLVGCAVVLFLLLLLFLFGKSLREQDARPNPYAGYSPSSVCRDAWEQDSRGELDHSHEATDHFDVKLRPGCFSGWVRVPRVWSSWGQEFVSDEPDRHVGFWFFGWSNSKGPYGTNVPDWNYPPDAGDGRAKWRMQGVGTVRYFRTR